MGPSTSLFVVAFLLFLTQTTSRRLCKRPIDLNTADISELKSLPYITQKSAKLITAIRPLCSPLQLTVAPKKIKGLSVKRLHKKWRWFKGQPCSNTCCEAVVRNPVCPHPSLTNDETDDSTTDVIYSWMAGDYNKCSLKCGKGTQQRSVECYNSDATMVDPTLCITLDNKPSSKSVCNPHPCPSYKWVADTWGECVRDHSRNNVCIQKRDIKCYDTANNILSQKSKCDLTQLPNIKQDCACKVPKTSRSLLWIGDETIGGVTVSAHLLNEYNSEQCNTDMYRKIANKDKTLVTRRACTIYIYVHIDGVQSKVDISWFYLDATLQARVNEIDNNVWNERYLSWAPNTRNGAITDGWIGIALPNDANIGEFVCNLYYQNNGEVDSRKKIADFTLYVLFNPYDSDDEVYMESLINRNEYVENEFGLIWVGNKDDNSAMKWKFDQFHYPNLVISMNLLDRLELKYRNNIVLISRHISYAVGADVCYGKWGQGPYTSGPAPRGGYKCEKSENNCVEPWAWTGTTQLFDVYRDLLKYKKKAQYCQCFVYAGVSTTVGRALGIPTRPTSNFQSAHDTDFNRAIESYWLFNQGSRTYSKTKGTSRDSVWNFHVWNEMFFKRSDFTLAKYNTVGWQAIDATPQERSFGGNPAVSPGRGAYQMGPAALSLIRENINTHQCKDAASNQERFGCFDTEFVISETNANYNFWSKSSTDTSSKFTLLKSFEVDPWDSKWGTIGCLTATKKPDKHVSKDCLNTAIRDCDDDYLDLTLVYKKTEPSDPGKPTDLSNYYKRGDKRHRRRLLWAETNFTFADLEYSGIEYHIFTIPDKEQRSPMIVAGEPKEIIGLYGHDYTFGMMSLNIDSFEDNALDIYCSVTATAHDYSGQQFGEAIKNRIFKFKLAAGQSSKLCQLYLRYSDYVSWVQTKLRRFDSAEIAYILRFTITASIYDREISDTQALEIIIEERDILVCAPMFKLRDRIICTHELDWFKPVSDTEGMDYKCDNNRNGVGDGFCDEINNYEGCYDGGDCCKSTCIVSKNYKCPYFKCIDPRIKIRNENFQKCPHISSFINYIQNLTESSVCEDVFMDECPDTDTGNECIDHIFAMRDLFDDDIESCYSEGIYSVHGNIINPIIKFVIDCMNATDYENDIAVYIDQAYNDYDNVYENNEDMYDNYVYNNAEEQDYNSVNDNHFKSVEYELIFAVVALILLIGFVVCFVCFGFGGVVAVLMSNGNKEQTSTTSTDEQSTF